MATFDETVKSALGATASARKGVRYLVESGSGSYGEVWPATFIFPPKRGDLVESENGRQLIILDIVHTLSGVMLKLGRNIHASSGISGGGRMSG